MPRINPIFIKALRAMPLALAALAFALTANAQTAQDTVRLCNGTTLHGQILERSTDGTLRLHQADGTTRTITPAEMAQTTDAAPIATTPMPRARKLTLHSEVGIQLPLQPQLLSAGVQVSTAALFRKGRHFGFGPGIGFIKANYTSIQLYGRASYSHAPLQWASPFVAADLGLSGNTQRFVSGDGMTTNTYFTSGLHTALNIGVQVRPTRAKVALTASMGFTYTPIPVYSNTLNPNAPTSQDERRHPGLVGFRLGLVY